MEEKIYSGDIIRRVNKVYNILSEKAKKELKDYYNTLIGIKGFYENFGWKALADFIIEMNEKAFTYYTVDKLLYDFFDEAYHSLVCWYCGYPASEEEELLSNANGIYNHIDEEDVSKIFRYLD